jgi:hypothetical protein
VFSVGSYSAVLYQLPCAEMGSVSNETVKIWSQVLRDLDLRTTAPAGPSSTCASKLQACPLVREMTLRKEVGLSVGSAELKKPHAVS